MVQCVHEMFTPALQYLRLTAHTDVYQYQLLTNRICQYGKKKLETFDMLYRGCVLLKRWRLWHVRDSGDGKRKCYKN